uniref:Uncharacterized protein n=1 Tax=Anguilla anguilla TaxID=7936 RepID=A0A0E9VRK8_ANGAN
MGDMDTVFVLAHPHLTPRTVTVSLCHNGTVHWYKVMHCHILKFSELSFIGSQCH